MVDGAVLFAGLNHQHDLFLGDGLLLILGVDVQDAQHEVDARGEQLDEGAADLVKGPEDADRAQGETVGVFHGDPLGGQFSENKGDVGEQQGQQHQDDRVQQGRADGQEGEPLVKIDGKILRCHGRGQKVCQGDADLDGREEVGRVIGDAHEECSPFVAFLGHFFNFFVVDGKDRDLARCKKCIAGDQHDQKQDTGQGAHKSILLNWLLASGGQVCRCYKRRT